MYAESWHPSCRDLLIGVSGNIPTHKSAPGDEPGALWRAGVGVRHLHFSINADTCQILARDRSGYVDVGKADTVAGRMGVIDSRDGADASYPQSHIGLDEGDLFTHLKDFRLRIHRAPLQTTCAASIPPAARGVGLGGFNRERITHLDKANRV